MKSIFHAANERGGADWGWLKAKHSFSFGQWYNEEKIHFGALRVLNDDVVAAGSGFPTHPHDNMEIITIPLSGALEHKDSTGGHGIIAAGDVQVMSAGSGVQHSEFNASKSDEVTLFQIWIFPKQRNITPRYDQKTFDKTLRQNKWQYVASGEADNKETLWINQQAAIALAKISKDTSLVYQNKYNGNGIYLMVINGSVKVADHLLNKRDAIGVYDTNTVKIEATDDAEILAIEVPMNFDA